MRNFLEERYADQLTSIEAEQYPPPTYALVATQLAGFAQLATVVVLMGGEKVFEMLGVPTPSWYGVVAENKMMTFGIVWLVNNMANQLIATGAFEIFVGETRVFSKLEMGRLPTVSEISASFKKLGFEMRQPRPAQEQLEERLPDEF